MGQYDTHVKISEKVYRKLMEVPSGKVVTYGQLAKAVGLENGQRAIGRIMSQNPYPGVVPCHRVIMASGKLGGYGFGGPDIKADLLRDEGIKIEGGQIRNIDDVTYRF